MNSLLQIRPFVLRRVAAGALLLMLGIGLVPAQAVELRDVAALAKQRASEPYRTPAEAPAFLQELSYEQARLFRFLPEHRLWRASNSLFQVSFIAPARHQRYPVKIHRITAEGVRDVPFDREQFDFGNPDLAKRIPPDLGYAGLRLEYPINHSGEHEAVVEFSGASYFRGVGKGGVLGLWARGLAIDTGLPGGEEFPQFSEFWLEQPRAAATSIRMFALLEGPSVTGGYEFTLWPGENTRISVRAEIFTRKPVTMLGLAPLTSMFLYGENTARPLGQWRPEMHHSDGLLVNDGSGEWLWRPLLNPRTPELYGFSVNNAKGFGLLQRDRRFDAYEDGDAQYQSRPGAWVTLRKPTGPGRIVLVEIPSPDETNDNIVAFWSPAQAVPAGQRMVLDYDLFLGARPEPDGALAAVVNTLVGRPGGTQGRHLPADAYRFVIDFAGGGLGKIKGRDAPVAGNVSVAGGKVLEQYVEYLPVPDRWRLVFVASPEPESGMEMRAFLHLGDDTLSETWSYHLPFANSLTP
ncbi:MAG: glucan biosynthesis protein G [Gammaproteobacteria bacterium]